MIGLSDPRSLYPSGTSMLRRPRLAQTSKLFKVPKPAKVGAVKTRVKAFKAPTVQLGSLLRRG